MRAATPGSPKSDPAVRQAVLFQVPLVVFLRPVELRCGRDLRDDRPLVPAALFEALLRSAGSRLLLGVEEEDGRPVLLSDVRSLAVERRRVVVLPEDIQELLV